MSKKSSSTELLLATQDNDLGLVVASEARARATVFAKDNSCDVYARNAVTDRVVFVVRHKHLKPHAPNSQCSAMCRNFHSQQRGIERARRDQATLRCD